MLFAISPDYKAKYQPLESKSVMQQLWDGVSGGFYSAFNTLTASARMYVYHRMHPEDVPTVTDVWNGITYVASNPGEVSKFIVARVAAIVHRAAVNPVEVAAEIVTATLLVRGVRSLAAHVTRQGELNQALHATKVGLAHANTVRRVADDASFGAIKQKQIKEMLGSAAKGILSKEEFSALTEHLTPTKARSLLAVIRNAERYIRKASNTWLKGGYLNELNAATWHISTVVSVLDELKNRLEYANDVASRVVDLTTGMIGSLSLAHIFRLPPRRYVPNARDLQHTRANRPIRAASVPNVVESNTARNNLRNHQQAFLVAVNRRRLDFTRCFNVHASRAPRNRSGLFRGQLPRMYREIISELESLEQALTQTQDVNESIEQIQSAFRSIANIAQHNMPREIRSLANKVAGYQIENFEDQLSMLNSI